MASPVGKLKTRIVKTLANAIVEEVGSIGYESEMRDRIYESGDWDDYFVPVITKSIFNARLIAEEGYMQGAINNLCNKTIINLQLIDNGKELKELDLKRIMEWLEKIDIYQVARDIYMNGLVDGESFIKTVVYNDGYLENYIKPIFLEVNGIDHFMKKVRNDDKELIKYIHYYPKKTVKGTGYEDTEESKIKYDDMTYLSEEIINPMYNIQNGKPRSPVMAAADDYYMKKRYEIMQIEVTHRDNLIIVSSQLDEENQPIVPSWLSSVNCLAMLS